MGLLDKQDFVSSLNPMPVSQMADSSKIVEITDDATIQLYYYSGTTRTADAGQAAGTEVLGQLINFPIGNEVGSRVGTINDRSLSFTSSDLTTEKPFRDHVYELNKNATGTALLTALVEGFDNGDYCVDYRRGAIYGVKESTGTSLTVTTYSIMKSSENVTIEAGDITITAGAFKVEDGTSTTRAVVGAANGATVSANALNVADANVLAKFTDKTQMVQLTDGTYEVSTTASSGKRALDVNLTSGGRNTSIIGANAETLALATPALVTGSAMYGMDADAGTPILRAVQVAVDNATVSTTPNVLITGGIYKAAADTYTDNDASPLHMDANGNLKVALSSDIQIGAVEIKDGTTDARQAVKVDNATASATPTVALVGAHYKATLDTYDDNDAVPFHTDANGLLKTTETPSANAESAPSAFRATDLDETPAQAVKASAGNVYGWNFYNPNGYDVFVKFYNTAQGSTTVGSTAVVETIQVPALGSVVIKEDTPIKSFSTAITIAATKLVADNDTTALDNDVFAHVYYK